MLNAAVSNVVVQDTSQTQEYLFQNGCILEPSLFYGFIAFVLKLKLILLLSFHRIVYKKSYIAQNLMLSRRVLAEKLINKTLGIPRSPERRSTIRAINLQ